MKKNKKQKASEVAGYYGFSPIESPTIEKSDIQKAKLLLQNDNQHRVAGFVNLPEKKVAMLRLFEDKKMNTWPQPVMLHINNHSGGKYFFDLEILGCAKPISEAIIIQTALAILREQGYSNLYVNINSLGERDSAGRFLKELGNFCRKHSSAFSVDCRQAVKKDPIEFFYCQNEKTEAFLEEAPKSIAFLSELAKIHFKEVLEYLEALDIPYRINNALVDFHQLVSHTIFEIRDLKNENSADSPLAFGFRYNAIARKIGIKKEIPAIDIAITVKKGASGKLLAEKNKKPQMFFAQIGVEAKFKSLEIIELLRQARVRLHQSLAKDKMSSQVAIAENMKIPYIIIMGRKEALEDAVIIRNMINRSQTTVPVAKLADYIKHLKN